MGELNALPDHGVAKSEPCRPFTENGKVRIDESDEDELFISRTLLVLNRFRY